MVKFDYRIVAKISIFQLVNYDYFFVKMTIYLNGEKRTRWIVRAEKMTYFRLRDQTNIGARKLLKIEEMF